MKSLHKLVQVILSLAVIFSSVSSFGAIAEALKMIPVQDRGRIKPYDSFARESLQLIYGKQSYNKKEAVDIVLTWVLIPQFWEDQQIIELSSASLREALKLKEHRTLYTLKELLSNERTTLLFQQLKSYSEKEKKLSPFYQDVQRLQNQVSLFHGISTGQSLSVMPNPESTTWFTLAELSGEDADSFKAITDQLIKATTEAVKAKDSATKEAVQGLKTQVDTYIERILQNDTHHVVDMNKIKAEVFLNSFEPFLKSWIFYLLGSLFLLIALFNGSKKVYWGSWGLLLLAFTFHTLGFLLRIYIVGRPPVSNMYETVVWVPWGAMVFAFIMEIKNKNRIILLMASLSAMLCLILTNVAPTVLDASLHPLEPVLRSTFWLTTHVLMITISYGAFLLAWGLGNLILVLTLLGENKNKKMIKESAKAIYGALKIGAVLLAGGIILGGVWADYSWGRFWGWDPKETWALIALLGYLAILHAKIVGWVRDFGLGVTAVVAFSLVIMAWYGVNFILGAGLHAYGFGTGGVEYVVGATVLELLFALYVVIVRQGSLKKG